MNFVLVHVEWYCIFILHQVSSGWFAQGAKNQALHIERTFCKIICILYKVSFKIVKQCETILFVHLQNDAQQTFWWSLFTGYLFFTTSCNYSINVLDMSSGNVLYVSFHFHQGIVVCLFWLSIPRFRVQILAWCICRQDIF